MVAIWALFLSLQVSASPSVQCQSANGQDGGSQMVERINQRYDDFYRYRHETEEHELERRRGVAEVHAERKARQERMAKALQEYEAHQRPRPDTAKLEARYLAAQKERREQHKAARECYVQQKERAEKLESHGRKIPENLEYDIED